MSGDVIDTTFVLVDKLTPALRGMQHELARTNNALAGVNHGLNRIEHGGGGGGLGGRQKGVKGIGFELGVVSALATKAVDALFSVGRAAVEGGGDLLSFAVSSASFKRNMVAGFSLMEDSTEKAEQVYATVKKFADKTPFETSDVMKLFRSVRAAGFEMRTTEDIMAGVFDVASLQDPAKQKESIDQMTHGLLKMQSAGQLTDRSLETLMDGAMGTAVNASAMFRELGKMRGVSPQQAHALMSSGGISAAEGVTAFLHAVQNGIDKGDPLGKATKKFGIESYDGQISTLKSRMKSVFEDVQIGPLTRVLTTLNSLLSDDSDTGKRIRKFANETLGGMFEKAGELLTPETIEAGLKFIVDALTWTGEAFEQTTPIIRAFTDGFGDGFGDGRSAVDLLKDATKSFKAAFGDPGDWRELGDEIGLIVKGFLWLVWAIGKVVEGAKAMRDALGFTGNGPATVLSRLMKSGTGDDSDGDTHGANNRRRRTLDRSAHIGQQASDGVALGVRQGAAAANREAEALASGVLDTTATTLEIKSPSRKMQRLGDHAGEGFRLGLEGSDAERAMRELVASPIAGDGGRGWSAGSVARGVTMTFYFGDILVSGGAETAARRAAADVRDSVEAELIAALERMDLAGA